MNNNFLNFLFHKIYIILHLPKSMDLIKSIKKTLLITLPLAIGLSSCNINQNLTYDPVYDINPPSKEFKKQNLENKTFQVNFNFEHQHRFDWDFDFDGIYDWADPWPYDFGPFIDMNDNGIVDWGDLQTDYNFSPFWHTPFSHNHFHNSSHNPFYYRYSWNYQFPSNKHKPENKNNSYYGPRRTFNPYLPPENKEIPKRESRIKTKVETKRVKYKNPKKDYQKFPSENRSSRQIIKKNYYTLPKNNSPVYSPQKPKTNYNPRQNRSPAKAPSKIVKPRKR